MHLPSGQVVLTIVCDDIKVNDANVLKKNEPLALFTLCMTPGVIIWRSSGGWIGIGGVSRLYHALTAP